MSDARSIDIDSDIVAVEEPFRGAVALFDIGDCDVPEVDGSRLRMAFMDAMQAEHTCLENALVRILEPLGATRPSGGSGTPA